MNKGTILRTILAVAVSIHTALVATDITEFHNPTANLIYKIVSIFVNFVVVAITTYYNNDFTIEADTYTKLMRQAKSLRNTLPQPVEEPEDAEVKESEVKRHDE